MGKFRSISVAASDIPFSCQFDPPLRHNGNLALYFGIGAGVAERSQLLRLITAELSVGAIHDGTFRGWASGRPLIGGRGLSPELIVLIVLTVRLSLPRTTGLWRYQGM
jgi:hypothetical protein